MLLQFHKVFAHLQSHDGDLRMIKKEMLDQGKSPKALASIETEVISHERRLKTVESELGIPRVSF